MARANQLLIMSCLMVISLSCSSFAEPTAASGAKVASQKGAKGKKPKSRTLKGLIDLAMKEGKDEILPSAMSEKAGFGAQDTPLKKLRYKASVSPDQKDHAFCVVLKSKSEGGMEPIALDVVVASVEKKGEASLFEGTLFIASLEGELQHAFDNRGPKGSVESTELVLDTETKGKFKKEMDFHQRTVVQRGLEFVR